MEMIFEDGDVMDDFEYDDDVDDEDDDNITPWATSTDVSVKGRDGEDAEAIQSRFCWTGYLG